MTCALPSGILEHITVLCDTSLGCYLAVFSKMMLQAKRFVAYVYVVLTGKDVYMNRYTCLCLDVYVYVLCCLLCMPMSS